MKVEGLIKKGFNHGYELQKKEPKFAMLIAYSFEDYTHPYA